MCSASAPARPTRPSSTPRAASCSASTSASTRTSRSLGETLNRVLPGGQVKVEAMGENLILSGQVANAADADKAFRLAAGLVAKPEQVINMLSIAGPEQVMLKVKIVEVSRTIIKQLGFNTQRRLQQRAADLRLRPGAHLLASTARCSARLRPAPARTRLRDDRLQQPNTSNGLDQTAGVQQLDGRLAHATLTVTPGDRARHAERTSSSHRRPTPRQHAYRPTPSPTPPRRPSAGITGTNTLGCLEAFERVGLVRTLAEPNLTAVSGESAKFLAGGEFPVPTARDNNGQVTVTFKPFGVGLGFTPCGAGRRPHLAAGVDRSSPSCPTRALSRSGPATRP